MKKRYIKYWLICLMLISFLSCSNDNTESLFPDSPAERIEQRNSELLNLLLAESNGFKGIYFTKNNEFGGFTFYMKFNADGTVVMTSDVDSDTDIVTSSYEVHLGSTTELVFTTRGHIQKVSDPDYPGLRGTGFKGTSVFQYFSNENGKITFRDIRNDNEAFFILESTGFSDFNTESVTKANASLAQRQNLLPTPTKSVFQLLRIENSNGTSTFNLNFDTLRLYASPRIIDGNGNVTELNFGIAFTENGLIISPALEFEGEVYEKFDYDTTTNSYVATANGTTATILFDSAPAFFTDAVDGVGLPGHQTFGYFPEEDGVNPLTSPGFDALVEGVNSNLQGQPTTSNWSFYGFQYYATPDSDGDVLLVIFLLNPNTGGLEAAAYWYTPEIKDNKLYLSFTGFTNGTGNRVFNSMFPLVQFFNSAEGLYFTDDGSFESDLVSYGNLSSTFTSADQPNLRVYGLWYN